MDSNPRSREGFYGRNSPEFGALFGPTKSIRAGENLFAWDSAMLRLCPVRFVRQVEGRCSATSNIRPKALGSNPSTCKALLAGIFCPAPALRPHHYVRM